MDPNHALNLTALLAKLPGSSFLARFRRVSRQDAVIVPHDEWPVLASPDVDDAATTILSAAAATPTPHSAEQLASSLPGPWGFFTSGYMLGLLVMAVLLHRMQNIIIPSRVPPRRARRAYRFPPTFASSVRFSFHRIYAALLPLNFASTTTRLALHLPSIYFLSKMLVVWLLLVLQTCEIMPEFTPEQAAMWHGALGKVQQLAEWSKQKEMGEICWSTFCAVCAAFLVEGFIKALDGIGSGFPIGNVNPNASPFNLVGYAFLLHVYSSPIAHAYHPHDDYPSRPDKHVIMTIAIPLLQLTIFHILSVSKRLSTHRLLPTALTSFLSLIHFHGTLFSHFVGFPSLSSSSSSSSSSDAYTNSTASSSNRKAYTASTSYPLLNYIPNIFETLLICTIMLTVFLNVVVQLLVRGRVDRVFSGLGVAPSLDDDDDASPGNTWWNSLPMDEDFGVLLLRIGTASLEATGLRGWGNEVAPIRLSFPPPRRRRRGVGSNGGGRGRARRRGDVGDYFDAALQQQQSQPQNAFGTVSLGRVSVGDVRSGLSVEARSSDQAAAAYMMVPPAVSLLRHRSRSHSDSNSATPGSSTIRIRTNRGLNNEVRNVDLGMADPSGASSSGGGTPASLAGMDPGTYWQHQQPIPNPGMGMGIHLTPQYQPQSQLQGRRTRSSLARPSHPRGGWWARWFRELKPFVAALWSVMKGCVIWLVEFARRGGVRGSEGVDADADGEARSRSRSDSVLDGREGEREWKGYGVGAWRGSGGREEGYADEPEHEEDDEDEEEKRVRREREVYMRFLKGEDISDDEDFSESDSLVGSGSPVDNWEGSEDEDETTSGMQTPLQQVNGEEEDSETVAAEEAFGLFKDFLRSAGGALSPSSRSTSTPPPPSSELVLAHMFHGAGSSTSPGPLTRKKWNAISTRPSHSRSRHSSPAPFAASMNQRREDEVWSSAATRFGSVDLVQDDDDEDGGLVSTVDLGDLDVPVSASACVVCTSEPREIICWPCRCLTMCDHCRESMASRSAPTKHRCPCCRQTVEGYSRIYIP